MNARWDLINPDNDMKFQHNHRYAEILFPEPRKTLSLGEPTTDVVMRKEEELWFLQLRKGRLEVGRLGKR